MAQLHLQSLFFCSAFLFYSDSIREISDLLWEYSLVWETLTDSMMGPALSSWASALALQIVEVLNQEEKEMEMEMEMRKRLSSEKAVRKLEEKGKRRRRERRENQRRAMVKGDLRFAVVMIEKLVPALQEKEQEASDRGEIAKSLLELQI